MPPTAPPSAKIQPALARLLPFLKRHGLTLAVTAVATVHAVLLGPVHIGLAFAAFIAAVLVAAWRDGIKGGLAVTAFALPVLAGLCLRQPKDGNEQLIRLGLFALVGALASYLGRECRRAVRAVDLLHDTVSNLSEAILFTDADGRVTFVNPLAQSLTGLSQAEARGKSAEAVLRLIDEGTRQPFTGPAAEVRKVRAAIDLPSPALLVSAKGAETPVEGRAAPVRDLDGNLGGVAITFREVTRRRLTEKEMRRREEQLRAALDAAPAGLFLLDASGRCTWTNRAAQALGGFTADEALGEGWVRFVHPEDRSRVLDGLAPAAQAGQEHEAEFRFQASAGWVRLRSAPVRDGRNEVTGHILSLEDITTRKQAEEKLRENLALLHGLLEATPDAVFVKNVDGRCLMANSAGARLLGQTAEELAAVGDDWEPPQGLEAMAERDREFMATRQPQSYELTPANGKGHLFSVTQTPYCNHRGSVVGHIDMARDVTDHRRAEEQLREAEKRLAEARKQAEEALAKARAEAEKQQREKAEVQKRAEAERRQAEEALRQAKTELTKQVEEQSARRKQAEESLRQAREELPKQAEIAAKARQAEEALRQARAKFDKQLQEQSRQRQEAEAALRRAKQELEERLKANAAEVQELRARLEGEASRARGGETARQRAEQLQAVLDGLPALVCVKDAAGRLVLANRAFLAAFRLRPDQVGQEADNLLPEAYAVVCRQNDRQALEAGSPVETEETVPAPDGSRTYLSLRFPVHGTEGAITSVGCLSLDVTKRRRAEELMRQERDFLAGAVRSAPDGVLAFDRDYRCTVWNPMMEQITGIEKKRALGRRAQEMLAWAKGQDPAECLHSALEGKRVVARAAAPAGDVAVLETAFAPLHGESEEIIGGLAIVRPLEPGAREERPTPAEDRKAALPSRPAPERSLRRDESSDWLAYN